MNPNANARLAEEAVESVAHAKVAAKATPLRPAGERRIEALGNEVRHDALDHVESEHRNVRRERTFARFMQVVDYLFGLLYILIGFEIALELFGANDANSFKAFLDTVTAPFLAPFETLLPAMGEGRSEFMLSYVVALCVYALIHYGIHRFLLGFTRPKTRLV